jgi:soluble P-type ATPase
MIGAGAEKAEYVAALSPERVVAVGNGANDAPMLKHAALGIAVLGPEGLSRDAADAAGVLCPSIAAALDLLLNPRRLEATLRP